MKKLKVGDEVLVYGQTPYGFSNGAEAIIGKQDEDGDFIALYPNGATALVHPRQCRLRSAPPEKKKQIKQRLERWYLQRKLGYFIPMSTRKHAFDCFKRGDKIYRMLEVGDQETVIPIKQLPLPNEAYVNKAAFDRAWGFHVGQAVRERDYVWDYIKGRLE
jgi:hypothetical protein